MNDTLMSTTSLLETHQIVRYAGIVTAHVVAGTNIFRDLFASFSDVVGGRCISYQRELAAIGREALQELGSRAARLGANGVVGVRVDHDEISGGGKSMLMVTASGTAVQIEGMPASTRLHAPESEEISQDDFDELLRKRHVLDEAREGELKLDEDVWEYAVRNQVWELAPYILSQLPTRRPLLSGASEQSDRFAPWVMFFSALPPGLAVPAIYEALASAPGTGYEENVRRVMDKAGLTDYSQTKSLLESDSRDLQLVGIRTLDVSKRAYTERDLGLLRECIACANRAFPKDESVHARRTGVTHREVKYWICKCGAKNTLGHSFCTECSCDRRGVSSQEARIDDTLQKAWDKCQVLAEAFGTKAGNGT